MFTAALIHGCALYVDYLLIYLINGWIRNQWQAIMIFTGIFIAGYILIWLVIYLSIRASANKMSRKLSF